MRIALHLAWLRADLLRDVSYKVQKIEHMMRHLFLVHSRPLQRYVTDTAPYYTPLDAGNVKGRIPCPCGVDGTALGGRGTGRTGGCVGV